MKKVSTAVIDFPEDETAKRAEPAAELGRQTPEDVTPEADAQASYLVRILKGVGLAQ